MSSAEKAFNWVGDRIGDGLKAVGDAAGDAIKWTGDKIKSAVDYGADAVRAIAKNPIPTLLRYGAMAVGASFGIPPYVTSAAITAAQGGNLEDVAKSAAVSYATTSFLTDTQIGADIKNYTVNEWSGDFTDSMMEKFDLPADTAVQVAKVSNAALTSSLVGGINAAMTGKSVAEGISFGFTSGLVNSSTSSYFDSVNEDPNWGFSPQALNLMKGATATALNTAISGKSDPAQAVGNYIAYASLNMAGSELWEKAKSSYASFTEKTKALDKAGSDYAPIKTEYDNKLKESEAIRTEINKNSADYKKIIDEKYTPFKTQYDKLIADNEAAVKEFNSQKAAYDSYVSSYENGNSGAAASANAAAAAANAAASRANALQDQAAKMYNDNKPMLDSLTAKSDEINSNVAKFDAIKYEIEKPVGSIHQDDSALAKTMTAVNGLFGNKTPLATIDDRNIAQKLKDASDNYQANYDSWSATKAVADKSAENYTKALAEVATRDATIDALNSGAITATKQDDAGNWVLSNGMTLTKDGKFMQDGSQQFTNAAGINQKPLDLTSSDGSKVNFSEKAGRLLSVSDAKNIAQRDYGVSLTDQEAAKFAGRDYTEASIPEILGYANTKATDAGFPDYKAYQNFGGNLDAYKASTFKPIDTSMAGGEQTAALNTGTVSDAGSGGTNSPTRYVPIQNVDANNKNAIAASDALSAAVARDGAPKNATFSPAYFDGEGYVSYVTSSDIDGKPTGYRMVYDPETGGIFYNWSGSGGEQSVDANGNPVLSDVVVIASKNPPKFDSTTGQFVNSSGQPVEAPAQTPSEPMPTDAVAEKPVEPIPPDVVAEKPVDSTIKNPFDISDVGTLLAIYGDGTSLVKNDSTGEQSTVNTVGDATAGSKVDLIVDSNTGETTAVVKTPDVVAPDITAPVTNELVTPVIPPVETPTENVFGAPAGTATETVPPVVPTNTTAEAGATTGAGTTTEAGTGSGTTTDAGVTTGATTGGVFTPGVTNETVAGTSTGTTTSSGTSTGAATGTTTGATTGATTNTTTGATTGAATGDTIGATTGTTIAGITTPGTTTGTTTGIPAKTNDLMSQFNSRVDQLVGSGKTPQEATSIAAQEIELGLSDIQKAAFEQEKAAADKAAADKAASNLALKISTNQSAANASNAAQQKSGMQSGLSLLKQSTSNDVANTIAPLAAGYLTAKQLTGQFESPLAKFLKAQEQPLGYENEYGVQPQGIAMNDLSYSYGNQRPIEDILNMGAPQAQDASTQNYTALPYAQGGMAGTRHGKYAQGGLSTPLMASGGKMRVDFRHGDAVTGAGDGQSDDIPAMLADGEFVFPADVVAAIGNGSTKAGSDKLYDMMHGIRAHARSAKPKDLPPQIKSPLDFLKRTA